MDNGSSGGYGCRRGCCDLGGISDGGYERGHGGGGGTGYSGHCCGGHGGGGTGYSGHCCGGHGGGGGTGYSGHCCGDDAGSGGFHVHGGGFRVVGHGSLIFVVAMVAGRPDKNGSFEQFFRDLFYRFDFLLAVISDSRQCTGIIHYTSVWLAIL